MLVLSDYELQTVEVTRGLKRVLLPFRTTANLPEDVTVEWRRSDREHMQVHVYQSGQNQPESQNQDYRGRTEMVEEPLTSGDLSLKLQRPLSTDSGVYTCTVSNHQGDILRQKVVILSVTGQ